MAFLDLTRPGDRSATRHRRSHGVHRPQRHAAAPAALRRAALSDRIGAGARSLRRRPGGASTLEPGEDAKLIGLLGEAADAAAARALVAALPRAAAPSTRRCDEAVAFWDGLLGTLEVKTPDRALDLMVNRWLLYQTLACRIWGRSAFYQSSGAFGFRDQLQDVARAPVTRRRISRARTCCAPRRASSSRATCSTGGTSRAARACARDSRTTGCGSSTAALHYVGGDRRRRGARRAGAVPRRPPARRRRSTKRTSGRRSSTESGSLYEHCVRAIALSLETGAHGLPLMGTGDWNDGMNLVGAGDAARASGSAGSCCRCCGRSPTSPTRAARRDRAAVYRAHAEQLTGALEDAWDGDWYRRAYFDDGTPLGSKENAECRIDAIAQSWAVISGAGDPSARAQAMASVDRHLVRRDGRPHPAADAAVRQHDAEPRLHPGLCARRARERRAVHARRALDGAGATRGSATATAPTELLRDAQSRSTTRTDAASVERYRVEPYVVAADVYSQDRRTSAAAAGPGTRARPAGCTASGSRRSWASRSRAARCASIPCIPSGWKDYEVTYRTATAEFRIAVENPDGVCRGVRSVEVDGVARPDADSAGRRQRACIEVRVVLARRSEHLSFRLRKLRLRAGSSSRVLLVQPDATWIHSRLEANADRRDDKATGVRDAGRSEAEQLTRLAKPARTGEDRPRGEASRTCIPKRELHVAAVPSFL